MRVNESVIHTITMTGRGGAEYHRNDRHAYNGGPGGIQHAAVPGTVAAHEQHAARQFQRSM